MCGQLLTNGWTPTADCVRTSAHQSAELPVHPHPAQGCMYKKMDAAARCEQLQSIDFQLEVLEGILDEHNGPFVGGELCVAAA